MGRYIRVKGSLRRVRIYGRSMAFDENWTENRKPTEEELNALRHKNDGRVTLNVFSEPIFSKARYSDLNEATNELAQQRWIDQQVKRFGLEGLSPEQQQEKLILMREDMTKATLQRILGHSDLKMTMIYAHLTPEHLEEVTRLNPLNLVAESLG